MHVIDELEGKGSGQYRLTIQNQTSHCREHSRAIGKSEAWKTIIPLAYHFMPLRHVIIQTHYTNIYRQNVLLFNSSFNTGITLEFKILSICSVANIYYVSTLLTFSSLPDRNSHFKDSFLTCSFTY